MSALVLLCGLGLIAVITWAVVRRLELRSATSVLLAGYVVGFAAVVAIVLSLSVARSLDTWTVLMAEVVLLIAALGPWLRRPSRGRSRREGFSSLRATIREPVVGALAAAVAVGLLYTAALGLITAPNDWDAMTYHLSRAAFWIQQQAVAYVPETHVIRINVNPPNAEIGALFTMLLSGGDRFVGLVQFLALLATAAGVYGIASRIGLDRQPAAFGALLFLTTPIVILQGSTALNDLVVCSFLVAATYFLIGERTEELALGGLALALAVGTKFTAVIALPVVVFVVLAFQPRSRWLRIGLASVAGVAVGSYWLVLNLVKTGSIDAGAGTELDQHPDRAPIAILARATRMLANFADDMGVGRDVRVYAIAAGVVLVVWVATQRTTRRWWLAGTAACAVACIPLLVPLVHEWALDANESLWAAVGRPDLAFPDVTRETWQASSVFSNFGPVGLVLLCASPFLVVTDIRRETIRRPAVILALAPFVFALIAAVMLVYDPWRGRFFMFAVALAAATWGVILSRRWLAWGVTSIAIASLFLAFVHSEEKPAGISLFENDTSAGVWGEPREVVQTWLRADGTSEVLRFFAQQPDSGRVGVRLEEDDWVFPYFGSRLGREVFFVPVEADLDHLDWLVLRSGRVEQPGPAWRLSFESSDGWRVFSRANEST